VPASATHLEFYLFKEVDRQSEDVRRSRTELPVKPEAAIRITLNVEQRPVSGHAIIDATPDTPGALGAARITLDWRHMKSTGQSRAQILEQLNRDRPRGYPNVPAPLQSHWAVWDALDVKGVIERFLSTSAGRSTAYESAVDDLRKTLALRSNPRFTGLDRSVNENLHVCGSDGEIPASLGKNGLALVEALRKKIDADLRAIGTYAYAKQTVQRLSIAGGWMFEACPEQVLDRFRSILRGEIAIGMTTDAIGRSVSGSFDVDLAFDFLARRIAAKRVGHREWRGAGKDLKAVANILRFRPEAARRLKQPQATMFVECALATMEQGLTGQGGQGPLQQNFLWATTTFLLALRYRINQTDFIAPPARGALADATFVLASDILQKAGKIDRTRRSVHRLIQTTVAHAIEFLNKTGGDPNIIARIMQELEADDSDDDA
jgi:hypothetical protein